MRFATWTPQGQCLATCSDDGTIRLWHFTVNRNIAEIAVLEGEEGVFQDDMKKWQKVIRKRNWRAFLPLSAVFVRS